MKRANQGLRATALFGGWALAIAVLLGLLLHVSETPRFAGRYSGPQVSVMLLVAMAALAWKPLVDFLATPERVRLASGRALVWRPWHKLLALGALTLAALLGAELWYRYALVALEARESQRPEKSPRAFHPFLQNALFPGDAWHVNSHGFRGEEIELAKPPGGFRIVFLGGSTVLASRVPFEQSHARLLERKLRARHAGRVVEVQNAANHWHTTEHSLIKYLFRVKDYQPDLVVLWHGINDLVRSFSPEEFSEGDFRSDYGHYRGALAEMVRAHHERTSAPLLHFEVLSGVAAYLRDALFSDLRGGAPIEVEIERFVSLAPFERNLRSLAAALASDGVPLLLATQACIYRDDLGAEARARLWMRDRLCREGDRVPSVASLARGLEAFNEATRRVAAEAGVPLLDLARTVPPSEENFLDDCHLSERGNTLVAEALDAFLAERGWPRGGPGLSRLRAPARGAAPGGPTPPG